MPAPCPICGEPAERAGPNLCFCAACGRLHIVPQEPVERPWVASRRLA